MSLGIPNTVYSNQSMITVNTMSYKMKEVLDAWLKYGTVFLIYRLCMYYFLNDGTDTELFDKESLLLALFILIGFTLYYLLVQPYIPVNFRHPIFQNIANDSLMFGTVLVSSHLMETYMDNGEYFNKKWLKTAGLILLAFAAYRVFINPFIPFNTMNPQTVPLVSDLAQYGTFLIAFRILQGESIIDCRWILSVIFVLLGFTGYHLITKNLIDVD